MGNKLPEAGRDARSRPAFVAEIWMKICQLFANSWQNRVKLAFYCICITKYFSMWPVKEILVNLKKKSKKGALLVLKCRLVDCFSKKQNRCIRDASLHIKSYANVYVANFFYFSPGVVKIANI